MKKFVITFLAICFLAPFVGFGLSWLATIFGCQNLLEMGCTPGVGEMIANIGLRLIFAGFFTFPFGVVGGIVFLLLDRKQKVSQQT